MNKTLTNKQIIFLVFTYVVGYGIISLPKNITKQLGTGGWISILVGNLIIIFCAYLFIYLAKNFNNKTIDEYSKILTNKFISYIIIAVLIIYSLSTGIVIIKLLSKTVKLSFLLNTPTWALTVTLIAVCLYTLLNEISILARVFEIFAIIFIIFALILDIATLSQGKLTNLQPFFILEFDKLYKVLPELIFPFTGIEVLCVLPIDSNKKNKKIFRYVLFILLFIGFMYIMNVESSISVMGIDSIVHYEDARFASIRRVEIDSLQFLKRLDSIFIVAWILSVFGTIIVALYMTIYLLNSIFVKISRNLIVIIVTSFVLILSLIPTTMEFIRNTLQFISYLGIFILFILPLTLSIITMIKKHYKKL